MSDIKFSILWAISGLLIALISFGISYGILHETFPGYKLLVYPGIAVTRLFSEEIDFWPKLGILLIGQYLAFFIAMLTTRKAIKFLRKEIKNV